MRQFYAYCLLTNHIHLLMREHDEQIEESVKRMDHESPNFKSSLTHRSYYCKSLFTYYADRCKLLFTHRMN